MFRLAHLSDVHLGPLPPVRPLDLASKRLTGWLNWRLNRARRFQPEILDDLVDHLRERKLDHIAVTGDLVNIALEAEFTRAREWLARVGDGEEVSLVCGNHDAYVPGALARALEHWRPWLGDGPINERDFPLIKRSGPVSFIAANSAVATPPFMATGRFDARQGERLSAALAAEAGRCRVVLIHHPPLDITKWHKRLVGADRFRRAIAQAGAELVLYGHTHVDRLDYIEGAGGRVPVVGVPAAGNAPGGHRPPARYNWFEIEKADKGWSIRMDEFGYGGGKPGISHLSSKKLV